MNRVLGGLRLVLAGLMVLTAINHFVPVVPEPGWDDPMADRLMTAFDRSGLLDVAKAIHLIAGALLLANRAAPFALAALMPVNICGLYISAFLEREPLIAVLASLTVALNGLLMLACLPSYRNVVSGGQLAYGERAEDGRNYNSLFVNPFGHAPYAAKLGGALVLAAALAFYWYVVPLANSETGLATLTFPALVLLIGLMRSGGTRSNSAGRSA